MNIVSARAAPTHVRGSLLGAQELALIDNDIAAARERKAEAEQVRLEEKMELEAELSRAISALQVIAAP